MITANMQIRIKLMKAKFQESDTCEALLDATGNFPAVGACRFLVKEARITLANTRLVRNHQYAITLKLGMPSTEMSAGENSFTLQVDYYQLKTIEITKSPLDITHTIQNAKNLGAAVTSTTFAKRGYVTGFTWTPSPLYSVAPGVTSKFSFGLRTFGTLVDKEYHLDVVANPP